MNKQKSSRLLNLKKWLTIPDASIYLSRVLNEDISESDILRFGLDGHLILSLNILNKTCAKLASIVNFDSDRLNSDLKNGIYPEELKWFEKPSGEKVMTSFNLGNGRYVNIDFDNLYSIKGVFDLPLIGEEVQEVEKKWQKLTGFPAVTGSNIDGIFLCNTKGLIYQLQSYGIVQEEELNKFQLEPGFFFKAELANGRTFSKKYIEIRELLGIKEDIYPKCSFPNNSFLVVQTKSLIKFEQQMFEAKGDESISSKDHGNSERYSKSRQQVLGSALYMLAHFPNECKNNSGKVEAAKIARMIDEKSYFFWQASEPPLQQEGIARLISKYINKIKD